MGNVVTDNGLADVVNHLIAASTLKWIGWGSGIGQDETDTDLASPLAELRTSGTAAVATTNTADDTYRLVGTIVAEADRVVSEVGVFGDETAADMGVYGDFTPMNIATGDSITFTIDVVVDQLDEQA